MPDGLNYGNVGIGGLIPNGINPDASVPLPPTANIKGSDIIGILASVYTNPISRLAIDAYDPTGGFLGKGADAAIAGFQNLQKNNGNAAVREFRELDGRGLKPSVLFQEGFDPSKFGYDPTKINPDLKVTPFVMPVTNTNVDSRMGLTTNIDKSEPVKSSMYQYLIVAVVIILGLLFYFKKK
jgi:hypothetical protein